MLPKGKWKPPLLAFSNQPSRLLGLVLLGLLAGTGSAEAGSPQAPQAPDPSETRSTGFIAHNNVSLRVLDKITDRSQIIRSPISQPVEIAELAITATHCHQRPPPLRGTTAEEFAAYIEAKGEAGLIIFKGWIFSKMPSINPLPHNQISLRLLECF